VECLEIHRGLVSPDFAKYYQGALLEVALPLRNLVGMNVELLGELGQRLCALERGQGLLFLNSAVWLQRGRLLICSLLPCHLRAAHQ